MNKIKLFLVAAAMVASPAMAGSGNSTVSYGNGWWDGWMAADVMYRVNGTASATGEFVGDVGKGAVETAANVGEGAVDVAGEVAGAVVMDIPLGITRAAGGAVAWVYQTSSGWYSSWYQADDCRGGYCGGFGR